MESDHLPGAVLTAAAAYGTAAVDGAEAAEELSGRLGAAALQVGPGASLPWIHMGACPLSEVVLRREKCQSDGLIFLGSFSETLVFLTGS